MHLHKFCREKFDFEENYFQNAKILFGLHNPVALAAKALFGEDIGDIIGAVQRAVGYHKG